MTPRRMLRRPALALAPALAAAALAVAGAARAQSPAPATTRGALLYETHCITCHTVQMHWRDAKAATDWPSLKAQVRLWQGNVGLGWNESDIVEVTRHLNGLHYRFPQPEARAPAAARQPS